MNRGLQLRVYEDALLRSAKTVRERENELAILQAKFEKEQRRADYLWDEWKESRLLIMELRTAAF
jgi:hypothetical protein